MSVDHLREPWMLDLFRIEAESQTAALASGLSALGRGGRHAPGSAELDLCRRAAHSLKGAAGIIGLDAGVRVAQAMEDCLIAAGRDGTPLTDAQIKELLSGADLIVRIAHAASADHDQDVDAYLASLDDGKPGPKGPGRPFTNAPSPAPTTPTPSVARVLSEPASPVRKRVLVVDDSLTVRERQRRLLTSRGYDVELAVDGMDGWNALRSGAFDLILTDVDMPRMDGFELVTLINQDPQLQSVPVMIVSNKDREEDRRRGFEAGAARYLIKGTVRDESLLQAVVDLIGAARVS